MKTPFDFDKAAQDVFSSEGGLPRREPWRPECVPGFGALSAFQPRRMPSLAVACPAKEGSAQRYRGPLWRPFKAPSS
jgi:hypothetical protein